MFTSMCVMDRMGKRDLRNTHDQGEQEAEVIRHAAYHVKTALPPLPEATPLQESHAAYVEVRGWGEGLREGVDVCGVGGWVCV